MTKNNSFIRHWGIPGMKWGRRNGPPYPLSESQMSSSERKQRLYDDITLKNKSNEELRRDIERLRLERDYLELNKSNVKNGSKFANALLLSAGTIGLTTFATMFSSELAKGVVKTVFPNAGDQKKKG